MLADAAPSPSLWFVSLARVFVFVGLLFFLLFLLVNVPLLGFLHIF